MKPIGSDLNRDIEKSLKSYLPKFYEEFYTVNSIIKVDAEELEKLNAAISSILNQFSVSTATWGLSRWEQILGIKTDTTKTYAQRREILLGHMRGIGTVTIELIENVASSYANGEVDVISDAPKYTVIITFVGLLGVPDQVDELKKAIRDIVPAHLSIEYVFRFYTYSELKTSGLTYNGVLSSGKTYGEIYNRGLS